MSVSPGIKGRAFFGNYCEGTACSGKTRCLGIAAELDGNFPGSFDLKDGFRQRVVLDKGLIGGIEEDEGLVVPGIIDPGLQLFSGDGRTGRIVGEAQIRCDRP